MLGERLLNDGSIQHPMRHWIQAVRTTAFRRVSPRTPSVDAHPCPGGHPSPGGHTVRDLPGVKGLLSLSRRAHREPRAWSLEPEGFLESTGPGMPS